MKNILSLGWVASVAFIFGSLLIGNLLEGYSSISQTVSEIGKHGSPFYVVWLVFSIGVGSLLILFSIGIIIFAKRFGLSITPGILMLSYGISEFFIGLFPSPHPLHNVFGLSMIVGYFSPLAFAISWKNYLGSDFKRVSFLAFLLVMLGIILNLTPAFAPNLYPLEYYGIVQRFLLFTFYAYCIYISLYTIHFQSKSNRVHLV